MRDGVAPNACLHVDIHELVAQPVHICAQRVDFIALVLEALLQLRGVVNMVLGSRTLGYGHKSCEQQPARSDWESNH